MANLPDAIAAARRECNRIAGHGTTHAEAALSDLLAALDAAQGEAVATVRNDTGLTLTADRLKHYRGQRIPRGALVYAAPHAPPAAPRVERYGDGVLVHWPEGVEQYVQVGDCVTGNLAAPPAAVPAGHVSMPVERVQHVIDLLAERAHLNNARSPAHNARLLLEATFTAAKENNNV